MLSVCALLFLYANKADGLFFGSLGGHGGACSCQPAPPPPVCQQQVCPPAPSCGGQNEQLLRILSPQFVPQFQPPALFQHQGLLPSPPPLQNPISSNSFNNNGRAFQSEPFSVLPTSAPQNFVPYQQPPLLSPPQPIPDIPFQIPTVNNENNDYGHFGQKTAVYAGSEQIEVEPSFHYVEQPSLIESNPNNVFLPEKMPKKIQTNTAQKIQPSQLDQFFNETLFKLLTTTVSTTKTTTTVTTTPAFPKTTTSEDIYDDDGFSELTNDYYESSRNMNTNLATKNTTSKPLTPAKKLENDILTNDYSENFFKAKASGVKIASELTDDKKCGDTFLWQIMVENIVASPTISKQLIFTAGKQYYNKPIDVVCSKNKFSYTVVSTKIFCEVTVKPVTCFAFFQPANLKKQRRQL